MFPRNLRSTLKRPPKEGKLESKGRFRKERNTGDESRKTLGHLGKAWGELVRCRQTTAENRDCWTGGQCFKGGDPKEGRWERWPRNTSHEEKTERGERKSRYPQHGSMPLKEARRMEERGCSGGRERIAQLIQKTTKSSERPAHGERRNNTGGRPSARGRR